MTQHGFARNLPWTVIDESTQEGASVTLGLDASAGTRAQYPSSSLCASPTGSAAGCCL